MSSRENLIGKDVIDSSIMIHKEPGPGLLESVYEAALSMELADRGYRVERQKTIPIQYRGLTIEAGFRADIVVNDTVILELKSIEKLNKSHHKQLLTYLRLADKKLGYLLNFGSSMMKNGIVRMVNGLEQQR